MKKISLLGLSILVLTLLVSCEKENLIESETPVNTEVDYGSSRALPMSLSVDQVVGSYCQTISISQDAFLKANDYKEFEKLWNSRVYNHHKMVIHYLYFDAPETLISEELVNSIKQVYADKDYDKLHQVIDVYYKSKEFSTLSSSSQKIIKYRLDILEKSRLDLAVILTNYKGNINRSPGDRMIWSQAAGSATSDQLDRMIEVGVASLCGAIGRAGDAVSLVWAMF